LARKTAFPQPMTAGCLSPFSCCNAALLRRVEGQAEVEPPARAVETASDLRTASFSSHLWRTTVRKSEVPSSRGEFSTESVARAAFEDGSLSGPEYSDREARSAPVCSPLRLGLQHPIDRSRSSQGRRKSENPVRDKQTRSAPAAVFLSLRSGRRPDS